LFAVTSFKSMEPVDPAVKIQMIENIEAARLYEDVVQPILEARCYDCHSSRKQKGELRLDRTEYITRGGKHGEVISPGPADSSTLYHRLVLPIEDEDHMPPGEKPQLSSSEIALIKYWIEEKAPFEKPIAEFESDEKIIAIIRSLQEAPRQSWVPVGSVDPASPQTLRKLDELGVRPMPLAANNNYLMVTFSGVPDLSDGQITGLREIKDQLVWLNLSHTRVSDEQMEALANLSNLRVLYLNNTEITDAGISRLSALSTLRWLSLVGTRVSDQSIPTFLKLENLTNLFLYQTAVTQSGLLQLANEHAEVKIDTGNYRLKQLPTDTIVYKKVSF